MKSTFLVNVNKRLNRIIGKIVAIFLFIVILPFSFFLWVNSKVNIFKVARKLKTITQKRGLYDKEELSVSMYKWAVDYVVGNTHKRKYVFAYTSKQAIKKARVKNIVDLYIVGEVGNRVG